MKRRFLIIAAICVAALEVLTNESQDKILQHIRDERRRQDEQWGGRDHDEGHDEEVWFFILVKHMGKLARLIGQPDDRDRRNLRDTVRIAGETAGDLI